MPFKKNINFILMLLVIVTVLLSSYLIFNGYMTLSSIFEGSRNVIARQYQRQQDLSQMYRASRERSLILLQMAAEKDVFKLDELRQNMRQQAGNFMVARENLALINKAMDKHWQALNVRLTQMIRKNEPLQNQIADLFIENKPAAAFKIMINEGVINQAKILSTIDLMSKATQLDVSHTIAALNSQFLGARRGFKFVGGLVLLVTLVLVVSLLLRLLRGENILKDLLMHREIQYKTLVDTVKDGMITMDKNGVISSFNRAAENIFGYKEGEVTGSNIQRLIDKNDTKLLGAYIKGICDTWPATELEFSGRRKDKSKIALAISFSDTGILGEQRVSGVLRDITAEKLSYEILLKYRDIFTNSDDALAFIDMHYVYQLANVNYLRLFNKELNEVIGLSVTDVLGDALFHTFENLQQNAILNDEVSRISQWVETPTGIFYLSVSYKPYHDKSGEVVGTAISIRDITEQKQTEEEYFKASKLESIGVLAGGIAHDFNNLLGGIIGNIEMALHSFAQPDKLKHYLEVSNKACQRAAGLTQQLLTFSKGGDPVKKNADIMTVLRESAEFSLHGSNIQCHIEEPDNLCVVNIDSGQIGQVIQNLIINARQAMPGGGDISICCTHVTDFVMDEKITDGSSGGDYIKITIEDNGLGMSEEVLDSIFEPYFTTRNDGSGLGLALSYSIIKKHHGSISAKSTLGHGSCFTIYLPVATVQLINQSEDKIISEASIKQKRIMIMDDDEIIREIGQALLEDMGYQVVHAENGEQAIKEYKSAMQKNEPIDLVIMDLTIMGGMGGKDTIKKILIIDPQAKAIVSSGYSNDPVMANYSAYGFENAISKPYSHDELAEVVSKSLSGC